MNTPKRRPRPAVNALLLCAFLASAAARAQSPAPAAWGTYEKLFSAQSPWNSRPVNPVLDPSITVPPDQHEPAVGAGAASTGVFRALPTDRPMTVSGPRGASGVDDPDSGAARSITLPRWPAGVSPSGSDGLAEIVDAEAGIVHSFWRLARTNGVWRAARYWWSPLNGSGFGDPAHYQQGARATGVPGSAGIIRLHELTDGKPSFGHALAMSLAATGLTNGTTAPAYVSPATSADGSAVGNTGAIAAGSLLMLPATFNATTIVHPVLKRVVATLKSHGAYVVGRNVGIPFTIHVENGGNVNLMPDGRDNNVAAQLRLIRAGLRKVTAAESWVDGDGNVKADPETGNILSMRGPWHLRDGPSPGVFDTLLQAVVFPNTTAQIVQTNANSTGLTKVAWALPAEDTPMRFRSVATGGASVRIQLKTDAGVVYDSNYLDDGQSITLVWPSGSVGVTLLARSGVGNASTVQGVLTPE